MEETNKVTINEVEYEVDKLSDEAKTMIAQIHTINKELERLQVSADISLFAKKVISDSLVKAVEATKE